MIGLIDSGVGGLSVLAAIEAVLPHEDCIYYADTAHFPYGNKPPVEILRHVIEATAFLLSKGIKVLVIACHTATIAALETLQKNFPIPIIGMVEPTIRATREGKTALLATQTTIDSGVYQRAFPELICMTCPELTEKIQKGESDFQPLIQKCIHPILGKRIDMLIVGCSHFTFAFHEIEEELDQGTRLLNPALAVAQETVHHIRDPKPKSHAPKHMFYVSGNVEHFKAFVEKHPPTAPYEVVPTSDGNS